MILKPKRLQLNATSQKKKTVIDIMKRLLLSLLLFSPASFADWGDVYYCQMTNWIITRLDGRTTNLTPLMRFQFKLDKTKNAIVYGKGSYFNGRSNKLLEGASDPSVEFWKTQKEGSMSEENSLHFPDLLHKPHS